MISAEWEHELKALPFKSRRPGRTLHLLKAKAKPSGVKKKKLEYALKDVILPVGVQPPAFGG